MDNPGLLHDYKGVDMETLSRKPTEQEIVHVRNVQPIEYTLDTSIYENALIEAGTTNNLFNNRLGKVSLLFNVAAGCGNIPQHQHLEKVHQHYLQNDQFDVIAVVVDDFVCHGYPEYSKGLQNYIDENNLDLTPGQLSKKYGVDNYNTTYAYSELTVSRIDKHVYDPSWVPSGSVQQEPDNLWKLLTGYTTATLRSDGIPFHDEYVPWVDQPTGPPCNNESNPPLGRRAVTPLSGNFTKFLVDKTGTRIKRFGNGFLLGERDVLNEPFPWWPGGVLDNGKPSHLPRSMTTADIDVRNKEFGVQLSFEIMCAHIDQYLNAE